MTAKTVNQDDPGVYHLFYGDENARPGADLTFFEYPGAVPGRPRAGVVHRIVPRGGSPEALDFWAARLEAEGIATERITKGAATSAASHASSTHRAVAVDPLRFADPPG